MKILHVSTRLILGGSQENTVLSCEGQARLGHDVHLAFGPIYGPEGSMLPRVEAFNRASPRRIATHVVPHLVREIHPIADARCYGELRALIRDIKPDVVHTHSSKAGILGRAAAWAEGGAVGSRRVVHTIHGPPFHRYEKPWRNALYIALERFAARRCHAIVSVADAMTRQFLEAGIGAPSLYTTVRSGMEVEPFLTAAPGASRAESRAALRIEDGAIVIGVVARLAELKGHDDLLSALEGDMKSNPRLRLLWVGDGWLRPKLEARLQSMGLSERVHITGMVPPERIPAMIRAMDLVVHPSYREGLPRVVPQALLCGVPVVAYDVDGANEVCFDEATGRLVRAGDVVGLCEAVRWMLDDPPRARATAERGREHCHTVFSIDAMVRGLERVYSASRAPSDARGSASTEGSS